jgi:two-component system sensor histidine kinase YcbA
MKSGYTSGVDKAGGTLPTQAQMVGRALLAGMVVALLAEISVSPLGTAFRFSLGPVGLSFFAMFFMVPAYLTGMAAGVIVPLVHALFAWIQGYEHSVQGLYYAMSIYLPETIAYSVLGLCLFIFRVHARTRSPFQLLLLVASSDFIANVVELAIRPDPYSVRALTLMVIVAVGRAAVSEGAFYVMHEGVRERQWAAERRAYMQRLLFASNLQTEAFFLHKSSREIEQVMAKAHRLYRDLAGHPGQQLALEIAKDIHEVKKDCQRTLAALNRLVEAPSLDPEMNLSEVLALVHDANRSYAVSLGKEIQFRVSMGADFRTPRFGRWVTILNNLVSNAVEACHTQGMVTISTEWQGDRFVLAVADTGGGIPPEDWELIFSPGFSTKLNPVTGAFSSGIGLTHVAGLVEAMNGRIWVEKSDPTGTVMKLAVPRESLEIVQAQE